MYALKILSGTEAGKTYDVHDVETTIGRDPNCDISIPNKNISKKHAKIIIDGDRTIFTDLNSTNGSFVNGLKVEVTLIKSGDKVVLYDTLMEFLKTSKKVEIPGAVSEVDYSSAQFKTPVDQGLNKFDSYIEKTAMPPFYLLMEKMNLKWVVGLFVITLIVMTAALSTFPLMSIIEESVEMESKNRAHSLSKLLATTNRESLRTNRFSAVSVDLGFKEPGVRKALIIKQATGEIISPARLSGKFLSGSIEGKVNSYRKNTERPHHTFKASSETIISMHPIKFYSGAEGLEITKYYAVIVYNAKALSATSGQTSSLFIQTLFLALIFGLVVFYVLFKVIEYPFKNLLKDLSESTDGNLDSLESKILFQPFQEIYISMRSLLNRSSDNVPNQVIEMDRSIEVQNLCEMVGYACLFISNSDKSILDYNPYFEELSSLFDIKGIKVSEISDQSLRQNIEDLIERCELDPDSIVVNDFEFSGIPYEVKLHAVYGSSEISYFVCAFIPMEGE